MQILHESQVLDSEIDRLGHMNVQYYMSRIQAANGTLLAQLGITEEMCKQRGVLLRQRDVYCRFHREQFAGAPLQVLGALLGVSDRHARCYFEIRNSSDEQMAASLVVASELVSIEDRTPVALPTAIIENSPDLPTIAEIPKAGGPRSLKLSQPRLDVTLDALQAQIVDAGPMSMMTGFFEAQVPAAACDEQGFLRPGEPLMFAGRRPNQDEDGSFGPPVLTTDEGHRFGWAIMETRAITFAEPRAHTRIVGAGADVALANKTRQTRRWSFDADSKQLLQIHDSVAVALDLDARRAIPIPRSMRASIEQNFLPDLA